MDVVSVAALPDLFVMAINKCFVCYGLWPFMDVVSLTVILDLCVIALVNVSCVMAINVRCFTDSES